MIQNSYLLTRRLISALLACLWPAVFLLSTLVSIGYWVIGFGWFLCIVLYSFWAVQELRIIGMNRLSSLFYIWLTLLAWGGLWLVLPQSFVVVYLLASIFVMYFLLRTIGKFGDAVMVWREVLVVFPSGILLMAMSQLIPFSQPVYLLIGFLVCVGLLRGTLTYLPFDPTKITVGSLVLGVLMTELLWVLGLMSVDFAWLGFVWFIIFHTIWMLYYHYIYQTLTKQRVVFQLVCGGLALVGAMVLGFVFKV